MESYQWISALFDNIAVPLIVAIGGVVVYLFKSFADRITKSIIAKNEAASLEKVFSVKSYVIQQISTIVDAAVASNMQIVDDMKKAGQKLTDDQIAQLQQSVKELVINSLPGSLTEESGSMIQIIGGQDKLYALIDALLEKSVYEWKIRKYQHKSQPTATEVTPGKRTYTINPAQLYERK